jgi:ribosomal protein S18 acetylase RimI-like enzyme
VLHVFGHNQPARALYRKLGYVERDVTMVKRL